MSVLAPADSTTDFADGASNASNTQSQSSSTESDAMNGSQAMWESDTIIPLPDGYECTVALDQCPLDTASNGSMFAEETDMERQAHERCEEDETASSGSSYVPTTTSSDLSKEDQEYDFEALPVQDENSST